ncbi:hypothetical protein BDV98DRAFT_593323 [Pterulicium gracile]|uniref:F-box domain-containing protein n=1 Tax=Pterulicium gracile TaxID=1884261 RepID=A0A5C3QJW5_9AGAR|nr:hypothetical protein BDV98DRAFT_593323 [Pterula gracilis]
MPYGLSLRVWSRSSHPRCFPDLELPLTLRSLKRLVIEDAPRIKGTKSLLPHLRAPLLRHLSIHLLDPPTYKSLEKFIVNSSCHITSLAVRVHVSSPEAKNVPLTISALERLFHSLPDLQSPDFIPVRRQKHQEITTVVSRLPRTHRRPTCLRWNI